MTSNRGMGGIEFVGPADHWCVVTQCSHVDMLQDHEVFQDQVFEEHASHFEVGARDATLGVLEGDNGLVYVHWPWNTPDNRVQCMDAREPHATGAKCGCIAEAYIAGACMSLQQCDGLEASIHIRWSAAHRVLFFSQGANAL